jgi:hypothetical protein
MADIYEYMQSWEAAYAARVKAREVVYKMVNHSELEACAISDQLI